VQLPFDNARLFDFAAADGPDCAGFEQAIARFDSPHPYLLFSAAALPEIRRRTAANPGLRARSAKLLPEEVPPPAEERRAAIKRRARRLINTAFIALTAEPAVAALALAETRREMSELAAAPSWKERRVIRSFLDCAEIAVAVALAYDWLYHALTTEERRAIECAIRRNVLEPALAAYEDRSLLWPRRRDNCALVSHSCILVAALSVLPCHRALSGELTRRGLACAWSVFSGMAPDGAWREGLSYWSLALRYGGLMVAALESTLGESFGLADRPGFAQTGDFALHAAGPTGAAFNFGDSEQRYDVSPLAWFAHRFGRPVDGWLVGDCNGWSLPFTAIWPSRARASPMSLGLPTGKVFHSGDLACFRNTWSAAAEDRPVYLAIKGGNVPDRGVDGAPPPEEIFLHAQADAGTFVVDGARHRWVVDLGSDDYDLPGYFEHGTDGRCGRRWRYYRSQGIGHNTLSIGGRDQLPNTPAAIVGSCVEGDAKWAVLDLSAAYGKPQGSIRRGAALLGRQVVIQDEIGPAVCDEVVWTLHTAAEPVALSGSIARFRSGADSFVVRILEPAGARFELKLPPPPRSFEPADVGLLHGQPLGDARLVSELPRRADDHGKRAAGAPIRRLQIVLPAGTPRLTVLLLPDSDGTELALPMSPLDHWLARRPIRLTGVTRRGCRARGSRVAGRNTAERNAAEHAAATRFVKSRARYHRPTSGAGLDHA
jgi:Heparinase II/III-like protein